MNVGQKVRTSEIEYIEPVMNCTIGYYTDTSYTNTWFMNTAIKSNFENGKSYYFSIPILKRKSEQKIIVEFYNNGNGDSQRIAEISVEANSTGEIQSQMINFVASPTTDFGAIVFRLVRITIDYTESDLKECQGRVVHFTELNGTDILPSEPCVYTMKNLLEDIEGTVTKIGVQSTPGTYMCINGEEIRIGYRGIYEIMNGIIIDSFCINPIKDSDFILDYQYK